MKTLIRLLVTLFKPGIYITPGIFFETLFFAGFASFYLHSIDVATAALAVLAAGIFFRAPAFVVITACSLVWASFGFAFLYNAFSLPLIHLAHMPSHLAHYSSLTAGAIMGLFTFTLSIRLHLDATGLLSLPYRGYHAYEDPDYAQYEYWRSRDRYENSEEYARREAEEERAYREYYEQSFNSANNRQTNSAASESTEQEKTPYEILGISPGATQKEIRSAYLAKLKLNHPDHFHNLDERHQKLANTVTQEIKEAYEKLCA